MSCTVNQKAWERLIDENAQWLDKQPDTCECKHIRQVLMWARSHKSAFEDEKPDYAALQAERDEAADAFLHIKEAIGEMSFGADLPRFFAVNDPTGKTYTIPGTEAKQFYDAIYRKLDATPPSQWLGNCRKKLSKVEVERDQLKAENRALKSGHKVVCDFCGHVFADIAIGCDGKVLEATQLAHVEQCPNNPISCHIRKLKNERDQLRDRAKKLENFAERIKGLYETGCVEYRQGDDGDRLSDELTEYFNNPNVATVHPKVITLCGSSRFICEMAVLAWNFEKLGAITMSLHLLPQGYPCPSDHLAEAEGVAAQMDELHLRKIDLSDEIFVVNVGGYIGKSTRREIEYAEAHGKPVKYLEALAALAEKKENEPTTEASDHAV